MVLADDAIAMFLHFTELTGSKVIFDILPAFSLEPFFYVPQLPAQLLAQY